MASDDQPTPLTVALVIDQLTFERLGPVIGHLTVGLLDYIGGVTLITPAHAAQRLSLGPVRVIEHKRLNWLTWDRGIRGILAGMGHDAPTIIHAISSRSFRMAEELALETHCPLIGHLLGSEDLHPRSQAALQAMQRVIAASEPLHAAACARHIVDAEMVTLIRPGLLPESGPTCFEKPDCIPTILCMSAFESATGIDRLIQAIKILVTDDPDLMLFLVGRGAMENRLRKLVEKEKLIKQVTFGQPMPDWLKTMRAADVFVVPGNVDRVDVRLLHALAAGTAAVTGSMPNSDFVIDGETAIVCPDPSPESLAEAIKKLLADRELARSMARQAQEHCKRFHSLSDMAAQTARVYTEARALETG